MLDLPWRPTAVNAGEVVYPPGGTYGPRTQRDYQLVALHRGRLRLTLDATTHHYEAGTVLLLRPGCREFFQFAEDAPTVHSWVAARPPSVPDRPGLGTAPPALPLSPELDCLMRLVIRVAPSGAGAGEPAASLARAALAYFWHEARLGATPSRPRHAAVAAALEAIRTGLGEPLALGGLARIAAVSPEHLCRLFRAEVGVSPMGHLWAERTREGLRLLSATGLPIQEIAARCGFATRFHFERRARAATGLSPTAYRRAHWNPAPVAPGRGERRPAAT